MLTTEGTFVNLLGKGRCALMLCCNVEFGRSGGAGWLHRALAVGAGAGAAEAEIRTEPVTGRPCAGEPSLDRPGPTQEGALRPHIVS